MTMDGRATSRGVTKTSSLLSRFAASTAALALVVAGLAALFTVLINSKLVNEAMERTVSGYSISLARQILASDDPEFWRSIALDHQVALWVQTTELERAFDAYGEPTTEGAVRGRVHGYVQIDVPASMLQTMPSDPSTPTGASPPSDEQVIFSWNLRHFARLHDPLVYGHLLLLIPVIGATYMFQRSLLRPLQGLRQGVESVARGDFGVQVPVVRMDEIGQVGTAFNQMTRQVEEMMADRERLLADVSHELRSPLARMKVALELLPTGEKRQSIQNDVREMESLISVLLEREWLRARTDRLVTEPVDLVAVVRRVVETFDVAPGVTFSAAMEPLVAHVDADLVRLLAQNLVDNAIKFSLPDSRPVDVRLETTRDAIRLLVSDDGPGIAAEDREEIFKPFVKLDPARGHRSGYGLGLNLCWRIVEAHGGSIEMQGNMSRGDRTRGNLALVELPRSRKS